MQCLSHFPIRHPVQKDHLEDLPVLAVFDRLDELLDLDKGPDYVGLSPLLQPDQAPELLRLAWRLCFDWNMDLDKRELFLRGLHLVIDIRQLIDPLVELFDLPCQLVPLPQKHSVLSQLRFVQTASLLVSGFQVISRILIGCRHEPDP